MVVGQRESAKTRLCQSIKHGWLAAPEKGTFQWPAAMISKNRALEICKGEICFSEDIPDRLEFRGIDISNVVLDERLAGDGPQ